MTNAFRGMVAALALLLAAVGLWAMLDPRSFYREAAPWPPFNAHLFHDIGSFLIGLGACLAAGLLLADGLAVALAGNAVAAVAHFVSHVVDRDDGGKASDPVVFGAVAALFVVLAAMRLRTVRGPITRR